MYHIMYNCTICNENISVHLYIVNVLYSFDHILKFGTKFNTKNSRSLCPPGVFPFINFKSKNLLKGTAAPFI